MDKKRSVILVILFIIGSSLIAQDINWARALQTSIYFYDANMCGPQTEEVSLLEWRGDCHVWDVTLPHPLDSGKTIDVSGGFHDCGDHVKFGQPQVYAIATLGWGYYEFKEAYIQSGQEQHILDVLKWGTDYIIKCTELDNNGDVLFFVYMVGKGVKDHTTWIAPELQTYEMDSRPGEAATPSNPASEVCGGAAAALAIMYLNYKEIDVIYAEKCLSYAKALYEFGRTYRGLGTGDYFYTPRDYEDDLSWAAVWLYAATGEMRYIDHIAAVNSQNQYTGYIGSIIATPIDDWHNTWVHCWDNVWGGTFTVLAGLFPEHEDFDYWTRWNLEYWSGGMVPHEDSRNNSYISTSPSGYSVLTTWGSARYNTAAQLCALVYNKYKPEKGAPLAEWARTQIQYLLGDNPEGYSYMVGYPSPEQSVKHPHHRAAHGSLTSDMNKPPEHRHVLWGGLVGGPDQEDIHKDITSDFYYNEVGVDYNAAIVGALGGYFLLAHNKGAPKSDFPPLEGEVTEFYIEAAITKETDARCEINLKLHNTTATPPRYQGNIMVRYFFNISELSGVNQTISDIVFEKHYDELSINSNTDTIINGPIAYDQEEKLFYMEFIWEYPQWYGDIEFLFSLNGKQAADWTNNFDASNDFSRRGLTTELAITDYIPVYVDGILVVGIDPSDDHAPTPTPFAVTPGPEISPTPDIGKLLGDVNGSGEVDIVDALLIAQYYVDLDPSGFNKAHGDVDCNGVVDIVDALLVARHYVGLVPAFSC